MPAPIIALGVSVVQTKRAPKWAFDPRAIDRPWTKIDWEIIECEISQSHTMARHGVLAIPKPRTKQDLWAQLHEARHIKRGANITGSPTRILFQKMLEEIAVECQELKERGNDIRRARDGLRYAGRPVPDERIPLAGLFLQYVFSVPVTRNDGLRDYFANIKAALHPDDVDVLEQAHDAITRDWSLHRVEQIADWLTEYFDESEAIPEPEEETEEAQQARKEAEEEEAEEEAAEQEAANKAGESNQVVEYKQLKLEGGQLDIHYHTAAKRAPRVLGANWRSTDTGTVVRRPDQLLSGRVFAARTNGGSVLIDVSGSMSFSYATLEESIRKLPRLWAATYSTNYEVCRLCIIARDGKIGDYDQRQENMLHPGGNYLDYMAIEHMLKAGPPPYVWISDGMCDHQDRINAMMRQSKIVRFMTLDEGILYLKGQTQLGFRGCEGVRRPGQPEIEARYVSVYGWPPAQPLHR